MWTAGQYNILIRSYKEVTDMDIFCGITWKNNGNPHYEIIRNGVVTAINLSAGIPLPRGTERHCTGYYDFSYGITGVHTPCPLAAQVAKGHQCWSCQFQEGFVALHNTKHLNAVPPQLRSYVSQEHLAAFGGGVVKVGTAARSRHPARWYEQGVLAAMRIASRPDGIAIRQLESRISHAHGITQTVRGNLKTNLISTLPSTAQVTADLRAVSQLVADDRDVSVSDTIWCDMLPTIVNLKQKSEECRILPAGSMSWSLLDGPYAIGQCLIWHGYLSNYLLDIKPLVGRSVVFTDVGEGEAPLQASLF